MHTGISVCTIACTLLALLHYSTTPAETLSVGKFGQCKGSDFLGAGCQTDACQRGAYPGPYCKCVVCPTAADALGDPFNRKRFHCLVRELHVCPEATDGPEAANNGTNSTITAGVEPGGSQPISSDNSSNNGSTLTQVTSDASRNRSEERIPDYALPRTQEFKLWIGLLVGSLVVVLGFSALSLWCYLDKSKNLTGDKNSPEADPLNETGEAGQVQRQEGNERVTSAPEIPPT